MRKAVDKRNTTDDLYGGFTWVVYRRPWVDQKRSGHGPYVDVRQAHISEKRFMDNRTFYRRESNP